MLNHIGAQGRLQRRRPLQDSALAIATSILMLLQLWRERRRMRRELATMSDRELHDIGVCRAEVADEISRSFWRDMKGRLP
jgi:uncharacterized protein YjiS (DUF1127 family)